VRLAGSVGIHRGSVEGREFAPLPRCGIARQIARSFRIGSRTVLASNAKEMESPCWGWRGHCRAAARDFRALLQPQRYFTPSDPASSSAHRFQHLRVSLADGSVALPCRRLGRDWQSPYWKVMIDSGTNVVVWQDDLKPDPKDNADLILAYHNRGLLAWLGPHWVCWGDLRTEYITTQQLRAKLHKIEK